MGNQIFLTVLSLSLSGSLVGLIILCGRPLTEKIFSKKWNYYVWLVMMARLILPISLGINMIGAFFAAGNEWNSISTESTIKEEMLLNSEMPEPIAGVEPVIEDPQLEDKGFSAADGKQQQISSEKPVHFPANKQSILSYLWIVWIFGFLLAACIKANDYRNFAAYVKADRKEITDERVRQLVNELSGRLGIKKIVKVYESPLISGPILIGLLHPCMILPEGIVDQEAISLILHHELIHYKKKDLWYKWLYQAVLCVHWFNPMLYLIGRKLNVDCELACDEAVMKILTMEGRKAYGNVLLDAAEHKLKFKKSVLATTLLEDKGTLKERLNGILHYKKTKGILAVLSVCFLGVIVVFAGFAGVKNDKAYSAHATAKMPMTGSYVSVWDEAAFGYTTLWDSLGETVGDLWDSVGDMWGSIGDALSDAAEMVWDYNDPDSFLANNGRFDRQGEAWKLYDDDTKIAGEDLDDCWQAYSYMGNSGNAKCKGLILNGSDTYEILYVKEAFVQKLDFEVELKAGKMKLVHVGADGTVTMLAELSAGDSFDDRISIPLTEGRNVVKIVGQGAKIKELSFDFKNQSDKKILKHYASEKEEVAAMICDEFRKGKVDADRLMNVLPYMEDEDIFECAKILFDRGEDLTMDQISYVILYGNSDVGSYLADAVEKGNMRPFTGEEIGDELIYYLDSADLLKLVESMEEKLDFEFLKELLIYLNAEEGEKCLDIYLEQGNRLSYEEVSEISYYLDDDIIKRLSEEHHVASDEPEAANDIDKEAKQTDVHDIEMITINGKEYYLVTTESQLRSIREYGLDKNYMQQKDITISDEEWISIGTTDDPFTGSYNGNGFKMIGFMDKHPDATLFGSAKDADLYNITFSDKKADKRDGGDVVCKSEDGCQIYDIFFE